MKICTKCGNQNSDSADFCTECKNDSFAFADNTADSPASAQAPKKDNTIRIALLVVAGLIVIFAGIFFLINKFEDGGSGLLSEDAGSTPSVAFTAGSVSGKTYTNEWANIRYTAQDDMKIYSSLSGSYYDEDGFCASNEELYVSLGFFGYDKDNNTVKDCVERLMESLMIEEEKDYDYLSSYFSAYIAGEKYTALRYSNDDDSVYCCICGRRLGDRIIVWRINGNYESAVTDMMNDVQTAD